MKKKKRIRRSTPERTQPIRSWSTLFGAASGAPGPAERQTSSDDDVRSPASHGVRLGYQVAEEHLRNNGATRGGWPDLMPGLPGGDAQKLAGRLLQYAADLSTGWLDLLGAVMMNGGIVPPSSGRAPGPFVATQEDGETPTRREASPTSFEIKLRVKSNKPVEVSASIQPSSRGPLVVHDLRMGNHRRSRIAGATIEWSGDALVLSLEVGEQHAPGLYEGAVVEEATSVRRGTVKVTVSR